MGLFDSIGSLVGNVARVVLAPVEIVADVADAMVKPVADGAQALVDEVKDLTP